MSQAKNRYEIDANVNFGRGRFGVDADIAPSARCLGRNFRMDQTVYKPGSVPPTLARRRGGHSSGPPVAGRFSRPTRVSGPATACSPFGQRDTPIWSCSRRGLPCRSGYPARGGLLPHPFTLARRSKPRGGLLSVALSLGSPPAGVTRRLVAVEPGLSSPSLLAKFRSDRPTV